MLVRVAKMKQTLQQKLLSDTTGYTTTFNHFQSSKALDCLWNSPMILERHLAKADQLNEILMWFCVCSE